MARVLRRCGILVLALILPLLAVTACGEQAGTGSSPTPSPTSIPTIGTSPTPVAGGRCLVSQLSLGTGQPNAGAGQIEQVFIFTNTSQTSCALYGYPGMQLLGGAGTKLPTTVARTSGTEQTVTLAAGGTASFLAQWHDQTGYTTPCAVSQQVGVTPPNAYSQLTISLSIQACPSGNISVTAVTAGSTGGQ